MAKSTSKPVATSKPSKLAKKPSADMAISTTPAEVPVTDTVEEKAMAKVAPRTKSDAVDDKGEITIEKKLIALYNLQQVDSQVDKIRIIRGELPLEVQDLEDEIAGLETRVDNQIQETLVIEKSITEKKTSVKDAFALIKKYEDQQMNVRNNREYDSLTKEIEYQNLEIQLSEKRGREFQASLDIKKEEIEQYQKLLQDRKNDLEIKRNELDDIIAETEKEENDLIKTSEENKQFIEDRLLTAYTRIRKNARNGLAVVQIERDACGGCFNKIPPQHQLDIRMHKKIIVCEYCGRILVDDGIVNAVH
jgi:predicted  nucleic acid-binding Zn-ribbon protein